jgi:hypothetical protein
MLGGTVIESRAPVQGCSRIPRGQPGHEAGTVAWSEHHEAWGGYARRYGNYQSAERIAERGGFGYAELTDLLGREPSTWRPIAVWFITLTDEPTADPK